MIRVVYRWAVDPVDRSEFVGRWKAVTTAVHATTDGALGSFCLQAIENETEILTIALWKSEAQWRHFIGAAPEGSMKSLHDIARQISATPYRQLGDETVSE